MLLFISSSRNLYLDISCITFDGSCIIGSDNDSSKSTQELSVSAVHTLSFRPGTTLGGYNPCDIGIHSIAREYTRFSLTSSLKPSLCMIEKRESSFSCMLKSAISL